jgi:signal transduction histidine kinase
LGAYGAVVGVVEVGTFVTDQMLRSIQPTGLDIQLWRENVPGVFFVSDAGRYVRLGGTNTPTAIELSPSEVTLMATAGRIVRPNPGGPGHLINVIAPLTFGGRDTGILLDICVDAGPQMELERFLALNFMWTAGLGVLCLVLAAVFGLRLVVGPIDRVADAMVSLASGRFSETVPMQERSGKLGELARAAERFRLTSVRLAEEERALRDANLKLRQANEQIMLANDAKSQILANVSHELRTPLNAILGFSDMMRSALLGPIPPRYRDYANDIHGAAEHLLGIVSDIIDLQRIETRALDLRVSTVDMHELCSSCIHLLSGQATSRGISVSLEAPSSEISILTDRQRVLQVGINLLSNAIKYSNVGSAVTVRIRADEYGCEIEVIDTGIGMTRDDIELALQPFRQVAAVRRREQDSVGLGLPIVRGLVEALGGELSIESEVGRGTRVTVKLRPLSIRAIDVNKEQFRPAPMNSTG